MTGDCLQNLEDLYGNIIRFVLKPNVRKNVYLKSHNKCKLSSIVVLSFFCLKTANLGDFEGFAFVVNLRVIWDLYRENGTRGKLNISTYALVN